MEQLQPRRSSSSRVSRGRSGEIKGDQGGSGTEFANGYRIKLGQNPVGVVVDPFSTSIHNQDGEGSATEGHSPVPVVVLPGLT